VTNILLSGFKAHIIPPLALHYIEDEKTIFGAFTTELVINYVLLNIVPPSSLSTLKKYHHHLLLLLTRCQCQLLLQHRLLLNCIVLYLDLIM
jgi:hypothetical protein